MGRHPPAQSYTEPDMQHDDLLVILARALGHRTTRQKSLPLVDQELWPKLIGLISQRFSEAPALDEGEIEMETVRIREILLADTGLPPNLLRDLRQHLRLRMAEEWPALYALLHTHRYLLIARQSRELMEKNDPATVLSFRNESARKGHDAGQEYVHLGRNLFQQGKVSQGLMAFRQGLMHYPQDPLLSRELALLYRNSGFLQAATHLLEDSLTQFENPQTRRVLGSLLLAEGATQSAAEVWLPLLESAPELLDPLEVVQLATALEDASTECAVWWRVLEENLVPRSHEKIRGAFSQLFQEREKSVAQS